MKQVISKIFCDRCGKEIDTSDYKRYHQIAWKDNTDNCFPRAGQLGTMDLCDDCYDKFCELVRPINNSSEEDSDI